MAERMFSADKSALNDALGFIEEELEKNGCPMKTTMQLTIAIEEMFVNIVNYAYPDGEGSIRLSVDFTESEKAVVFQMADKGIPFDPLQKTDPDITLSAEERQIGGLGIYMMKQTMDSVHYAYKNNENILTMKKFLKD